MISRYAHMGDFIPKYCICQCIKNGLNVCQIKGHHVLIYNRVRGVGTDTLATTFFQANLKNHPFS